MKKRIWIFNHYATNQFFDKGGRHYNFGVNLVKEDYEVIIFCADTVHNSKERVLIRNGNYEEKIRDGIRFVFIRTCAYQGNGTDRIRNMCLYYKNIFDVTRHFEKPDIMIGTSMHILACVAALRIKKRYEDCKVIIEMRDLWTESLIGYRHMSRSNPLIVVSYLSEKRIYKKADAIIFTMPGGRQYIKDRKWSREISKDKIYYINNGVDLLKFEQNKAEHIVSDEDLNNSQSFKIIYAGAIREANCIDSLIKAFEEIETIGEKRIEFLLYGDGEEREKLQKYVEERNIKHIKFKGRVDKKFVPYILSRSDLNILNVDNNGLWEYGSSQNKLFDYLAAGKPIFCNAQIGYSILNKYHCGLHSKDGSTESIKSALNQFFCMSEEERMQMGKNAYLAAERFDFSVLTKRLINIIETI